MARTKKLIKVDESIEKTKAQIIELQQTLRELEQEKTKLENIEIVGIIRKSDISIEQLSKIIKLFKTSNNFNVEMELVKSED